MNMMHYLILTLLVIQVFGIIRKSNKVEKDNKIFSKFEDKSLFK